MEGMIGKVCDVLYGLKPIILMVIAQLMLTGITIFLKLAAADQFSFSVLVTYRFLFSAVCIVPMALYIKRNERPKMTWKILFQGFLCGAFGGALSQNLYAKCLALTSATFAAAITNLIPIVIFIMALIFRLEKLGWNTAAGKAKIFGTLLSISGAMLLTFYKGPEIDLLKSHVDLLTIVRHHSQHVAVAPQHSTNMFLGAVLGLCFVFCNSLWVIIQAKMAVNYPCPYSSTALMSVMAFFQGLVYALCTERDWSQWKLGWNIRLLTVAYTGVLANSVTFTLIVWCVQMRGPLFVSSFNPLLLVFVAIAGFLFLEESLHLGSVLGAIIIVCGLYVVLWGKAKELKKMLLLVPEGIVLQEKDVSESKRVEINVNGGSESKRGDINVSDRRNEISVHDDEAEESDIHVDIAKS